MIVEKFENGVLQSSDGDGFKIGSYVPDRGGLKAALGVLFVCAFLVAFTLSAIGIYQATIQCEQINQRITSVEVEWSPGEGCVIKGQSND